MFVCLTVIIKQKPVIEKQIQMSESLSIDKSTSFQMKIAMKEK